MARKGAEVLAPLGLWKLVVLGEPNVAHAEGDFGNGWRGSEEIGTFRSPLGLE